MKRGVAFAAVCMAAVGLGPSFACSPIVGVPLSQAPVNACGSGQFPCDQYDVKGAPARPQCKQWTTGGGQVSVDRCDFGRPDFPFTIVINVPDSSFYAPGRTFVLTSNDLSPPSGTAPRGSCVPPTCLQLPQIVEAEGKYRVTKLLSEVVGMPLAEGTSIPIRVSFVPLAPDTTSEATQLGIPLDTFFTSSRLIRDAREQPLEVSYLDTVSVGRYRRIAYPEPPFDAFFPPAITTLRVSERFLDDFRLGVAAEVAGDAAINAVDDDTGLTRTSTITRAEGLDGWRSWIADADSGQRISSIKALSGTAIDVVLHTVGQTQPTSSSLRDRVDVIVAPPEGWFGVPRLQSPIFNGGPEGFRQLDFPELPPPTTLTGVVADGGGPALIGVPSRLLFTSTRLRELDGTPRDVLKYATTVSTDDDGRFATVLPPGFYDVTIEPAEGTGFSKVRTTVDTTAKLAMTFRPPPRTVATGQVMLSDGRPLTETEVLAVPSHQPLVGTAVKPRPARSRTDAEGRFRLELDQGQYDLIVDPQPGTGFARLVRVRSFAIGPVDLAPIIVEPPSRLAFAVKDPSQVGNPIVRAMVRVFAVLPGQGAPAVEVGRAMTNAAGEVEILLAHQPR